MIVYEPEYAALIAKLDGLKTEARRLALRRALRAAGSVLLTAVLERVPVQAGSKPRGNLAIGELKADIGMSVSIVGDNDIGVKHDRVTVGPGPNTRDVARWVEYGHPNRRGRKGAQTVHGATNPHPFLRPAWDASKEQAAAAFEATLTDQIAKAMQ
jgi:HK97 gp10 family phage protein